MQISYTFHIPVLGLVYSVDTPLKVARYGINSVVSIDDDELIERMCLHHAKQNNRDCESIAKTEPDCRARRIKALPIIKHLYQTSAIKQKNTRNKR